MASVDDILQRIAQLIRDDRFEELESESLEIKPVPATKADWHEQHKSVNAFLNTRGGILLLGIREEGTGPARRYRLTGWQPHAEPNIKELSRQFTDREGHLLDLADRFPPAQIKEVLRTRVAVVYVDELPADKKFAFYRGTSYKRQLTGDHKITQAELEQQEQFKEEAAHARELQPVPGMSLHDLDLDKLNQFIFHLNQPVPVETLKSSIEQARPFLERRSFVINETISVLGALVCGNHPRERLGFRAHVHGYVDAPQQIAQDKQDYVDNVLPLMESTLGYLLRNIQVGIVAEEGGKSTPQYPEALLRETVNNALAHRDYSINRQVIVAVKPGVHISIQNPGTFRSNLLIESTDADVPIRRIRPEAKPRNPKLADVLRVYRKWEGRGIGMATLVNMSLQNQIDLPYYRLMSEEVRLHLCAGKLLDDRMERLFASFDGYIASKRNGNDLTPEEKLVLSYIIKSEWANRRVLYTILLTTDNNHFGAILDLERAKLIHHHPASTANYPIYVADRTLLLEEYAAELRQLFSAAFDGIDPTSKRVLGVVYRYNNFSRQKTVSAKQASFTLWHEDERSGSDIEAFDAFYRKVRRHFNRLEKDEFVLKDEKSKGYRLNLDYLKTHFI